MNKEGRPPIWKNKEQLQEKIDQYFAYCRNSEETPTIAGLAYSVEVDRQTIYNYKKKDEFFDTIEKARDYIMYRLEVRAIDGGAPAGTIFMLKNYGYTDRYETDNRHTIEKVQIEFVEG